MAWPLRGSVRDEEICYELKRNAHAAAASAAMVASALVIAINVAWRNGEMVIDGGAYGRKSALPRRAGGGTASDKRVASVASVMARVSRRWHILRTCRYAYGCIDV